MAGTYHDPIYRRPTRIIEEGASVAITEEEPSFERIPARLAERGTRWFGGQDRRREYRGDLFVGAARTNLKGGYLFHFDLTRKRNAVAVDDPRLKDRVADNRARFDLTQSESMLIGRGFGASTDIQTGPNGHLYVISLTKGAIYEIYRTGTR